MLYVIDDEENPRKSRTCRAVMETLESDVPRED